MNFPRILMLQVLENVVLVIIVQISFFSYKSSLEKWHVIKDVNLYCDFVVTFRC